MSLFEEIFGSNFCESQCDHIKKYEEFGDKMKENKDEFPDNYQESMFSYINKRINNINDKFENYIFKINEKIEKIQESVKKTCSCYCHISGVKIIDDIYRTYCCECNFPLKHKVKYPEETFDFMMAVKYLKEGKKVRIKSWDKNWFLFSKDNTIYDEDISPCYINLSYFESKDWEIYNE